MKNVVLIILDGWGIAAPGPGNAITEANLPYYQTLLKTYPHGLLEASGEAVGLPRGEAGNTETGHLNIGAGTVVYQDLPRINLSIADGSFFKNGAFLSAIDHCRKYNSNLHLLGLIGAGGVHSNIEHLLSLLQLTKEQGFTRVFLHLFTDGRDSPPNSAILYINQIETYLSSLGHGYIASVMGRYFAMDRDHRWDRTEKAYRALTQGKGEFGTSASEIVTSSYAKNITDEFIIPSLVVKDGNPISLIKDTDSVIFYNYRVDRPRQLTNAFVLDQFEEYGTTIEFDPYAVKYYKRHAMETPRAQRPFIREKKLSHLFFVTMTQYSSQVKVSAVAYPPHIVVHPLAEVLSENGLFQLRAAESEKERFVTYYFSGQREAPFPGEDRLIVPSPNVSTYDLKPEMSVIGLTDELIARLSQKRIDFTVVNFANADMVGHTGDIRATIRACETIDQCLSKLVPFILTKNGAVFITADHGNAEEMINPSTKGVDTEHSTYPVPFLAIDKKWEGRSIELEHGILADVAPTLLGVLGIKYPLTMTGRNLLQNSID